LQERPEASTAPGASGQQPLESPFKGKTGIVRIVHAFFSAFRQETLLAVVLVPAAFWVPVTPAERSLLIATVLLVMIVELLNTGVEVAIDRISFEHNSLSKRAKDIGSAAVFVALVLMAVVWGLIAGPHLIPAW
jgi:diacylglycerol kinase (ATP)